MVLEVSVGAQAHLVENEGLVLDSSWEIARREREGERERGEQLHAKGTVRFC
jgi:hypothetical protein